MRSIFGDDINAWEPRDDDDRGPARCFICGEDCEPEDWCDARQLFTCPHCAAERRSDRRQGAA